MRRGCVLSYAASYANFKQGTLQFNELGTRSSLRQLTNVYDSILCFTNQYVLRSRPTNRGSRNRCSSPRKRTRGMAGFIRDGRRGT